MSITFIPASNEQFNQISTNLERCIGTLEGNFLSASIVNSSRLTPKQIRCESSGKVFIKFFHESIENEDIKFCVKSTDFSLTNITITISTLTTNRVSLASLQSESDQLQKTLFIKDSLGKIFNPINFFTFNTEFIDIEVYYKTEFNLDNYNTIILFNNTLQKTLVNFKIRFFKKEFDALILNKNIFDIPVKIYLERKNVKDSGSIKSINPDKIIENSVISFFLTSRNTAIPNIQPTQQPLSVTPISFPRIPPLLNTVSFLPETDIFSVGSKSLISGEMGTGDLANRIIPSKVPNLKNWIKLSLGIKHGAAITSDTSLWTWGYNSDKRASYKEGLPATILMPSKLGKGYKDVVCTACNTFALNVDGALFGWGLYELPHTGIPNSPSVSTPAVVVNAGVKQLFSIISDKDDVSYQTPKDVQFIFAIKEDNTLWAWGHNGAGQLGLGHLASTVSPNQVGLDSDWCAVASGIGIHVLAIKIDGSLWSWGYNAHGQLGLGNTLSTSSPTQVGIDKDWKQVVICNESTLALKEDGTIWQWGYINNTEFSLTPKRIETNQTFIKIASGYLPKPVYLWPFNESTNHTFLLLDDLGTLYGWSGTDVSLVPKNLSQENSWPPRFWDDLSCGLGVTFLKAKKEIKTSKRILGCGANSSGQLGLGDWVDRNIPTPILFLDSWKQASCTEYSSILDENNRLWTFGPSSLQYAVFGPYPSVYPETGSPSTISFLDSNSSTLTISQTGKLEYFCFFKHSQHLQFLNGPESDSWSSCSSGNTHFAAIKSDGSLWVWGSNDSGELGLSTTSSFVSSPVQLGSLTSWQSVSCGNNSTIAIQTDGTLWSWGKNVRGQLGLGNTFDNSSPSQIGSDTNWFSVQINNSDKVVALKNDGTLWHWGTDFNEDDSSSFNTSPVQIGVDNTWKKVSLGFGSIYGIKQDSSLWSWGFNTRGELGLGDGNFRSTPTQVLSSLEWEDVCAGSQFALFKSKQDVFYITPTPTPSPTPTLSPTESFGPTPTPTASKLLLGEQTPTPSPTPSVTPTLSRPNLNIVIPVTPSLSRRAKATPLSSDIKTRITLVSPDGVVAPMIDSQKNSFTLIHNIINVVSEPTSELAPSGGEALCRYILKPVVLNSDMAATRLLISFAASIPEECFIRVFYRVLNTVEDFETDITKKHWRIVGDSGAIKTTTNEFRDFEYEIAEIDYDDDVAIKEFNVFSVKIVMESSNDAKVPFIKDFRTIALI